MRLDGSRVGNRQGIAGPAAVQVSAAWTAERGHMFCERRVNCEYSGVRKSHR